MGSISDWLEEATPDRREIPVCFDRRLVSEAVSLKKRLVEIEQAGEPRPRGFQNRLRELEDQIHEKSRVLTFEGLGWGAWRDLIAHHPPAPDQAETFARAVQLGFMPHAVENVDWNAETFVPAAIVASCVEPKMTLAEAERLLTKAAPGVLDRIWTAVLEVNLAGGNDPFVVAGSANGSGGVRASAKR